jgi:hypothetical protein
VKDVSHLSCFSSELLTGHDLHIAATRFRELLIELIKTIYPGRDFLISYLFCFVFSMN